MRFSVLLIPSIYLSFYFSIFRTLQFVKWKITCRKINENTFRKLKDEIPTKMECSDELCIGKNVPVRKLLCTQKNHFDGIFFSTKPWDIKNMKVKCCTIFGAHNNEQPVGIPVILRAKFVHSMTVCVSGRN